MRKFSGFIVRPLVGALSMIMAMTAFAATPRDAVAILKSHCVSCHGPEKQEGGLRLDGLEAALAGGDNGASVVPGNVDESLLIRAVRFDDPDLKMPPKNRLTDGQIQTLTDWVAAGAIWPRPVKVLFDDEVPFLAALKEGEAPIRWERTDTHSGDRAVAVGSREKFAGRIPGWAFAIRETPSDHEYRYLRFAWKKIDGGGAMFEVARDGEWPPAQADPPPGGRYVAGPNATGLDAIVVGETAPEEWAVVTLDLWQDLGEFTMTGLSLMAAGSGETLFDTFLLGATRDDLDAWSPGEGEYMFRRSDVDESIGPALTDPRNPIRQLFHGERLDLWSLRHPRETLGDQADGMSLSPTLIDRHVDARLSAAGLKRSPEADRRSLLRRVTFDLTGLPPSPEETANFLADQSDDAYARAVDRLLASPAYGERQARFWLDVVRYADTHGYERDEFRPLIWQYRDYVVRAFNQDKPYDQFIREQLAGDELVAGPPQDPQEADALIATGYLRLGQWDSTATIFQEEDRLQAEILADLTNTTASAFLGLTFTCCQCHDHKYDPLSQADHYRLRAFFAGLQPRDDLVIELPEELARIETHNAAIDAELAPLKEEREMLDPEKADEKPRHDELGQRIDEIESRRLSPQVAMGASDSESEPPEIHVFYQGDFRSPRDAVEPGFVSVLSPGPAKIQPPREQTSGRRLALADWIASTENPWTARVLVNRIWQQHFHTGLVATPNDFGLTGARPTHPELLDSLAMAFMNEGWSVKSLHRAVLLSATYRQSSHAADIGTPEMNRDPDNRLLWRQNVRRLDAETIRDSLLAVSGLLSAETGGQPRWPEVPEELLHAQPAILEAIEGKDGGRRQGWYTDPVEQTDVRSLYLVRKRCLPIPFLQAFDLPDTTVSCARRDATVVAPQALMLLNSPAAIRFAEAFADRIAAMEEALDFENADLQERTVDSVFLMALQRDPDSDERRLAGEFLVRHQQHHRDRGADKDAARSAFIDLCRAVLNLNEFVFID